MPRISILVPIFNVQKYLRQCLQSICDQTFKDIEIICLDDGSTDASGAIIDEFASKDSRIISVHKPNSGYGASLNLGLTMAKGDYIGIVESDDYIDATMFEGLFAIANKTNVDIVKSNCYFCKVNENPYKINIFNDSYGNLPINQIFDANHNPDIFLKLQTIWSAIYSRHFLLDNNIRFNETQGASFQDVSFAFQVYACAKSIYLTSDAYYFYRIDNITSSVNNPTKIFCTCDEVDYMENFVDTRDCDKKFLKQAVSRLGLRVMLENYLSIGSNYQYALLVRIREYLKKWKEQSLLSGVLWEKDALKKANSIIDDINGYYIDTTKYYYDDRLYGSNTMNDICYFNGIIDMVKKNDEVVIYGAGVRGKKLLDILISQSIESNKISFAVSDAVKNPTSIDEFSVNTIENYLFEKDKVLIIISIKDNQVGILNYLKDMGFKNIIAFDKHLWNIFIKYGSLQCR